MVKHDLSGQRFGKLVVLHAADNKGKNTAWICKCDCGVIKPILTYNLISMKSKSCGCVRGEKLKLYATTHGESSTRLYRIYKGMKQRCYNNKNPAYKYYGGKGICVFKPWLDNYNLFMDWAVGNGYNDLLSIDRIDPSKGYSPDNCRWATTHQQQTNKLNSMFVVVDNLKLTISEWADLTKTKQQTLYDKFYRLLSQLGLENENVTSFEINTKQDRQAEL